METIYEFEVFDKYDLVAQVKVFEGETVDVKYHNVDVLNNPLPMENPTIKDVADYLESRCFPETRHRKDELLEMMGLRYYIPQNIVEKTHGLIAEDYIWLKFPGETIGYEDIKIRD